MNISNIELKTAVFLVLLTAAVTANAGEGLFGGIKGAETLPAGSKELYQKIKLREGKSAGSYQAIDYVTEFEYGVSDRFTASAGFKLMSLDTSGLVIDGYLPKDKKMDFKPSGLELSAQYMFLSPAISSFGLAASFGLDYSTVDPHSGQDKNTYSFELDLQLQKFFLEGELIWVSNFGLESTYADRAAIANLPEDFDWPTEPEMELEPKVGTGVSYRFMPKWFVGVEAFYDTEFETEVGQERWSVFAGPNIHYGSATWWATLAWLPQMKGGGEQFDGQDTSLHLIEKTEQEWRLIVGFNL